MGWDASELMAKRVYREHIPVLLRESVEFLIQNREGVLEQDGIYVDATLGGGGHSLHILSQLDSEGQLYSIDQDWEAIEAARDRIGVDPRFVPLNGNFGYLESLMPLETHGKVNGILFDLGVSTHQIREAERGFSFQDEGPLDMRMSEESGYTAYDVVNTSDMADLVRILFEYGEERYSRAIAKAIVEARPVESTGELRRIVESVVKGPKTIKSVARVFQAIRIEVNQELERLKMALDACIPLLAPGGRIVAISYHSLEDRMVKTFFKCGNHEGRIEKDFYGNKNCLIEPLLNQIIVPTEEEMKLNPASRSAKMRIGIRTEKEI